MKLANNLPSVLVTSVGAPPGLNALRSLFEAGEFELVAADANKYSPGLYQYTNNNFILPYASEAASYISQLKIAINKFNIKVIIPCIEEEIILISSFTEQLKQMGVNLLLPAKSLIVKASNKEISTQIAKENKISSPLSLYLNANLTLNEKTQSLNSFLNRCPYPLIFKPVFGHGMKGIIKIDNLAAASEIIPRLNQDYIVQEFIPGKIGSMHLVGLLYDQDSKVVQRFSSKSIRTLYPLGGPATAGISLNCPALIDKSEFLISKIGNWVGPLNVEWMLDPRDNEFKFIEINPRLWGYGYLATASGINFARDIVNLALKKEITKNIPFKEGVTLIRSTIDVTFSKSPIQ